MPEFALRTKLEPPFGNHRSQTLGIKIAIEMKSLEGSRGHALWAKGSVGVS